MPMNALTLGKVEHLQAAQELEGSVPPTPLKGLCIFRQRALFRLDRAKAMKEKRLMPRFFNTAGPRLWGRLDSDGKAGTRVRTKRWATFSYFLHFLYMAGALGCGGAGEPAKGGEQAKPVSSAAVPANKPKVLEGTLPLGARVSKPEGHLAGIRCLSFSPDGNKLVSGSNDGTVLVWDVETGRILKRFEGHTGFARSCVFFPDGERMASGDARGQVAVWKLGEEKVEWLWGLDAADSVYSMAIRPDGTELLVGTRYGRVMSWTLATGAISLHKRELRGATAADIVWAVGYIESQAFGAGEAGIGVWDAEGEQALKYRDSLVAAGTAVLPGTRIALGGWAEIQILEPDKASAKGMKLSPLLDAQGGTGHTAPIYGMASNSLGDRLLSTDYSGQARLWKLEKSKAEILCSWKEKAGLWAAAFDSTHQRIAVAGDDASIALADAKDCRPLRRFSLPRGRVYALALQPNAWLLGDGTGQVSSFSPHDFKGQGAERVHRGEVSALVALAPQRWVSVGTDHEIFEGPGAKQVGKTENTAAAIASEPNGQSVLVGDYLGNLQRIYISKGITSPLPQQPSQILAIAIDPKGGQALVGGSWLSLTRLDLTSDSLFPKPWDILLERGEGTSTLCFDAQGKIFAQGGTRGTVLLRQAGDGLVVRRFLGLSQDVSGLVFQDSFLWAGGLDRRLVRWNLNNPQSDLPDLSIQEEAVIHRLQSTPDGHYLIAGLGDGRASVRSLPTGELIAHLYPFADGSWATVLAERDGKPPRFYMGSGPNPESDRAAFSLEFEVPGARKVGLLKDESSGLSQGDRVSLGAIVQPMKFTGVDSKRDAQGRVSVKATIFSPSGPPRVWLDNQWEVKSIYPNPGQLMVYDLRLSFSDPRATRHTLKAQAPGRPPFESTFNLPADPRAGSDYKKALVIGIENYGGGTPKALGALKDAQGMARALADEKSWKLNSGTTLQTGYDLQGQELRDRVKRFFGEAKADETLLFYFAGHSQSLGNEGFLLGKNDMPGASANAGTRISASELWSWIGESKAPYIALILDACRASNFLFPQDQAARAKSISKSVVFLLATQPAQDAGGSAQGGYFTQALLNAFQTPNAARGPGGELTVQDAAYYAMGDERVRLQGPTMFGTLLNLPLAWPAGPKLPTRHSTQALPSERGGAGSVFEEVEPIVESYRQAGVEEHILQGVGADRGLLLRVRSQKDLDKIRVRVTRVGDSAFTPREHLDETPTFARRQKDILIKLGDVPEKVKYKIELEPCVKQPEPQACQIGGGFSFERDL